MKNYYKIMLGNRGMYADLCNREDFIGADYGIEEDLTSKLPEDWKDFNSRYIPVYLQKKPGKSNITAGSACGALWTISKGIKIGDIVLSPNGRGKFLVGEVASNYYYEIGKELPHRRKVKWFPILIRRANLSSELRNSTNSGGSSVLITPHAAEIEKYIAGELPGGEPSDFIDVLQKFFEQVISGSMSRTGYPGSYQNLELRIGFGVGKPTQIPWLAFLKEPNKVKNGIFPVYFYYKLHNVLILAYGISEEIQSKFNWPGEAEYQTIKQWFTSNRNIDSIKFGNSLVKEVYDMSKELVPDKLQNDLNEIIDEYSDMEFETDNLISKFEKSDMNSNKNDIVFPLNQILYGPPGTGKTYNTINKALEIMGYNMEGKERSEIKREFEKYVTSKQIVFTTFHQSMSYEDFIEGIKPEFDRDKNVLGYPTKPGLFKLLCRDALQATYNANIDRSEREIDFDALFDEFLEQLKKDYDPNGYPFQTKEGSEMKLDKSELDNNQIVAYYRWSNASTKTAEGKTAFRLKKEKIKEMYDANVKDNETNLKAALKSILSYHLSPYYAAYKSFLYYVKNRISLDGDIDTDELEVMKGSEDYEKYLEQLELLFLRNGELKRGKPYILIIDEINRGNVSQILGELITLIEDSKRFGKSESLKARLPYSKTDFSVPENVYIIGTMNTADKSVEALDSALRRRFSFEFIPPKESKVPEFFRNEFNRINERLEFLLDKDHQIGHSYFMEAANLEDLKPIFKNKIIPLLQEFFYNDYRKIHLVLGDGFVSLKKFKPVFAIAENEEMERDVYSIKTDFDIEDAVKLILAKG